MLNLHEPLHMPPLASDSLTSERHPHRSPSIRPDTVFVSVSVAPCGLRISFSDPVRSSSRPPYASSARGPDPAQSSALPTDIQNPRQLIQSYICFERAYTIRGFLPLNASLVTPSRGGPGQNNTSLAVSPHTLPHAPNIDRSIRNRARRHTQSGDSYHASDSLFVGYGKRPSRIRDSGASLPLAPPTPHTLSLLTSVVAW